ncbi:MAG: ATP-binding protein [Acidobacteria bacterium]|nr:ATP-binding protein [Acidobacteriota bacterium]
MKYFLSITLVALLTVPGVSGERLTKVWETNPVLITVESINYDGKRDVLYASCINGGPAAKDGNGFIAKLKPNGTIIRLKWITDLNAPKGATIAGDTLYVSDIDVLVEVDISSGKITGRFLAPNAKFLNDVAVGPDGMIYVSDSSAVSTVYRFDGKKLMPWFHDSRIPGPNGLAVAGKNLLVGSGKNGAIASVSFETGSVEILTDSKYGVDGLIPLGKNRFLTSDWQGHVGISGPDSTYSLLLNTTARHVNAADLGYIPSKKLVIVPTFFHNTVAAYKIE